MSHNKLAHIFGLEKLSCLVELDVSYNQLTDTTGMMNNTQLRVLSLSGNRIKQVGFIEHLTNLESLQLDNNCINLMDDIRSLSYNLNLKNLWMKGNPASKAPFYKFGCRNLLPGLITLDGVSMYE